MIQKATAMGNWWLAASSWWHAHSCITPRAEIFGKTTIHPGGSAPLKPFLVLCNFWPFPNLISPLKGKRFQSIGQIQENMMEQLTVIGRTVWGPKVPILKGTEASLSCVQCFLYLVSSSINVSIFQSTWLNTFWTGLKCTVYSSYLSASYVFTTLVCKVVSGHLSITQCFFMVFTFLRAYLRKGLVT